MKPARRPRRSDPSSKLILQEIIGLTVKNANGLASNASSAKCVYVAGCVVVLYDAESGAQSHLMVSHRSPKPLSCVAVSCDGHFVAAGESGNQPSVLIWDSANLTLISELKDHLYGVACIAFSPDGKYLVSVGGYICLWDWQGGQLVAKIKASSSCLSIASVTFSLDAKHILTAGSKHLKLWSVGFSPRTRFKREIDTVLMQGKPINLGPEKGNSFVSVTSPLPVGDKLLYIYALTESGTLCFIQSGSIIKSLDLKVEKGFALSASEELVACACNNGLVKLISAGELECAGVLSMAEQYHFHEDSYVKSNERDLRSGAGLPDAVACQFLKLEKIAVVYGDHSLYIWDIHDVNKATRCFMLVSHSTSIWDIKNLCCENLHDPALACSARGCSGGISFATCSADGTIRLWDFLSHTYSQILDSKLGGTTNLVSSGIFERDTIELGIVNGFRSLAVSSDGVYLAAGDCSGNLHIYNLQSSDYMCLEGAHDAEILSLGFNLFNKNDAVSGTKDNNHLLASGGRDRVIHVYDVKRNFDLVQSIVDHSAAVTSVKLTGDGHKLVSCSADRSLVVRDVFDTDVNFNISRCHHQVASSGTVYDMVLDPSINVAVTVGQDKKINTFDIASGQLMRSFKPNKDFGDPIKVNMDPSSSYLVCSYSNKSICIYDFVNGGMIAQAMGHSEVITGVVFLPDCKHVISVGGEGCIFVWKLPAHLSSQMLKAIAVKSGLLTAATLDQQEAFTRVIKFEEEKCGNHNGEMLLHNFKQTRGMPCLEESCQGNSRFKFRISLLPTWAQTKVMEPQSSEIVPSEDIQTPHKTDPGESGGSCITDKSGCTGIDGNETSPMTQNNSDFIADNRWLTVYTVFMDSQSSPAAWGPKDDKILFSSPVEISTRMQRSNRYSRFQEPPTSECSLAYNYERSKKDEVWGNATASQDKCDEGEVFADSIHDHVSVQPHPYQIKNEVQERADDHTICTKFEESDLFKEHFGNLSATHKIERRELSARKRYSSRFVVRRNFLGGQKKLIHSPGLDLGDKSSYCHKESVNLPSNSLLEDAAINVAKKLETVDACDQPLENSMGNLMDASPQEGELRERIDRCSKALLCLETVVEATSRLFSELLAAASEDELSGGPAAQLFNNAAERLPSISEKVNELVTLARVGRSDVEAGAISKP